MSRSVFRRFAVFFFLLILALPSAPYWVFRCDFQNFRRRLAMKWKMANTALIGAILFALFQAAWAGETEWKANIAAGEDASRKGDFALAEQHYLQAITEAEITFGGGHPNVTRSVDDLVRMYYTQKQYAKVEPLYKRSLAIREKALGPVHLEVAKSLDSLAGFYLGQLRTPEAGPLYKRSLEIREKALGPEHPDVATSLRNLAMIYAMQGRLPETVPLNERRLAILEKTRGRQDTEVLKQLMHLSSINIMQLRFAEAEPYLKRCIDSIELTLADETVDHSKMLAEAVDLLEKIYRSQGRNDEIESLNQRVSSILQKRKTQAK